MRDYDQWAMPNEKIMRRKKGDGLQEAKRRSLELTGFGRGRKNETCIEHLLHFEKIKEGQEDLQRTPRDIFEEREKGEEKEKGGEEEIPQICR